MEKPKHPQAKQRILSFADLYAIISKKNTKMRVKKPNNVELLVFAKMQSKSGKKTYAILPHELRQ